MTYRLTAGCSTAELLPHLRHLQVTSGIILLIGYSSLDWTCRSKATFSSKRVTTIAKVTPTGFEPVTPILKVWCSKLSQTN